MRKTTMTLALITLMAGAIFTSCHTSDRKDKTAQVEDAKQGQKEMNAQEQTSAISEEWKSFKTKSQIKINDNEIRIVELKATIKTSEKKIDVYYKKTIDKLEQKNQDLKMRMEAYEKTLNDWESFRRDFNHDLDETAQALIDLTTNN